MEHFSDPDAYVIRYEWHVVDYFGIALTICAVGAMAALAVSRRQLWLGIVVVFFGGLVLLAFDEHVRAAREHRMMFAVDSVGVHFGGREADHPLDVDRDRVTVPWHVVEAVVMFRKTANDGFEDHVGVRVGPAAIGSPRWRAESAVADHLCRPGASADPGDLEALRGGADRFAAAATPAVDIDRQQAGWRVDQRLLVAAVHRFAPSVPVLVLPDDPSARPPGRRLT